LKDLARSTLAWQSIVADVRDARLNLDQIQSRQATRSLDEAVEALGRMVKECYKWLISPMQEAKPGGVSDIAWEHFPVNPAAVNRTSEIERILKENELLITEWSPIHLANLMRVWFWKDGVDAVSALEVWQKSCPYLYLPRLRDSDVLRATVAAGAATKDFFALAYGRDGSRFTGFTFGKATTPILDATLLLSIRRLPRFSLRASSKKRRLGLLRKISRNSRPRTTWANPRPAARQARPRVRGSRQKRRPQMQPMSRLPTRPAMANAYFLGRSILTRRARSLNSAKLSMRF
jgi:hypothetical protein